MNLYAVTLKSETGTRETFHIPARTAKQAIDKSYKKYERMDMHAGELTVTTLELIEEGF